MDLFAKPVNMQYNITINDQIAFHEMPRLTARKLNQYQGVCC
jgi:hypothetical protein